MNKKNLSLMMVFLLVAAWVSCAGSAEESTANFGAYISATGTIIPPEQIITGSFIGKVTTTTRNQTGRWEQQCTRGTGRWRRPARKNSWLSGFKARGLISKIFRR